MIEFTGIGSSRDSNLNSGSSVSGNVRIANAWNGVQIHTGADYDASSTEISGSGKLVVDSGITAKTGTLNLVAGQILGDGNVEVSGQTTWSRGQIGGDAGIVFAKGGLSIEGNAAKSLGRSGGTSDQGGLVNQGAGTWSAGSFSNWANGRFINDAGASLDIQADTNFIGGFFENKGSLTKSAGAGGNSKTNISAEFTNTGTVDVQIGELNASGAITQQGEIRIAENAVFSAANLTNHGLVTGDGELKMTSNTAFINDGRVAPGDDIGKLTLIGDYTQTENGIFEVTLGGTGEGEFDFMSILGDFTLDGTVEVSLSDGFIPDFDDTFMIMASTGDWLDNSVFDSIVSVSNPGITFHAIYGADFVKLGVSQVPVPAAVWLFGSALIGLVGVSRRKQLS